MANGPTTELATTSLAPYKKKTAPHYKNTAPQITAPHYRKHGNTLQNYGTTPHRKWHHITKIMAPHYKNHGTIIQKSWHHNTKIHAPPVEPLCGGCRLYWRQPPQSEERGYMKVTEEKMLDHTFTLGSFGSFGKSTWNVINLSCDPDTP
jgi:hypothetical protein